MRIPPRRSVAAALTAFAVVSIALVSATARADEAAPAGARPSGAEAKRGPAPHAELDLLPEGGGNPQGMARIDLVATSFSFEQGHFVNAAGFGITASPWAPRALPGMRFLNFGGSVLLGDFGDRRHGPWSIQFAYKPEWRVWGTSVVAVYVGARNGWTGSHIRDSHRLVSSLSVGPAIRLEMVDGFFGFEVGTSTAFAVDGKFRSNVGSAGQVWAQRVEASVSTNLCAIFGCCNFGKLVAEQVDLAEALKLFLRAELDPGGASTPPVCTEVAKATSMNDDGSGCNSTDPGESFFCRLEAATRGKPYEPGVKAAHEKHTALAAAYAQFQADARAANALGKTLRLAEQYLVDPAELRRVLRCEKGADEWVPDPVQLARACKATPAACTH